MGAHQDDYQAIDDRLRARILGAARKVAPPGDAEDLAHDAIVRLLKEVARPGAPALEIRALAKLRDVRIDRIRKIERDQRLMSRNMNEAATSQAVASGQDAYRMVELSQQFRAIAGADAMAYALVKMAFRATESDVASILGWPDCRAAAARVQLGRKKAALTKLLKTFNQEEAADNG